MQQDKTFQKLVDAGNEVGEIIGVDSFLVRVRGLHTINVHAVVRFEDGTKGYVHHAFEDYIIVMELDTALLQVGMVCVVEDTELLTKVGKNFVGRVINIFGDPIDGKGEITADDTWDVFHNAPMLYERQLLDTQLETGITVLDVNFSLVRGQRMAVLGDGKVGKTAMTTQIAINQKNSDITVIYVLIAKRQRDVAQLIDRLEQNKALQKAIVIVTNMFESLVTAYLAPYIGAAHGEYFWQKLAMDTLIIYDDLTNHAQAYREISLLAGVSPGRDSYPGDMFYTHSSLVERAGRLDVNHASQTILPIVYAPSGDITAYLPTNVMSMTDGQWILDMNIFKDTMRPAVSTGLSVTRVGGVGQNKRQKALAAALSKTLAGHRQAEEYAHFGTELSQDAQNDYDKGKALFKLMNQAIGEDYSLMDQQFMLDLVLNAKYEEVINIEELKKLVKEYSAKVVEKDAKDENSNFPALRDELKSKVMTIDKAKADQVAAAAKAKAVADEKAKNAEEKATAEANPGDGKDDKGKDKKDDSKKDEKTADKPEEKKPETPPSAPERTGQAQPPAPAAEATAAPPQSTAQPVAAEQPRRQKVRRPLDIQAEEFSMRKIVSLTSAFESLSSMKIMQTKNRVLQGNKFFNDVWTIYKQIRVDAIFNFGRDQNAEVIDKEILILITAPSGLTGDIDQRLIKRFRDYYDADKHVIVVIGHHGVMQLEQLKIHCDIYLDMPKGDFINIDPLVKVIQKYRASRVFYQNYISLSQQEILDLDLSELMGSKGIVADLDYVDDDKITERNYIFEPSTYELASRMEVSMMRVTLTQFIYDSRLAQLASRFRAMTAAKERSVETDAGLVTQYRRAKRALVDVRLKESMAGLKKLRAEGED